LKHEFRRKIIIIKKTKKEEEKKKTVMQTLLDEVQISAQMSMVFRGQFPAAILVFISLFFFF